jgi:outer membrane protein OmpA-like peptidoglycan-associated protein
MIVNLKRKEADMKRLISLAVAVSMLFGMLGCSSWSRTQKGAAIGTAAGAAVGAVIGKRAGNTAVGAILGAAVGGAAGAYIGNYMDKQAEEIERDLEGATVERVGEGIKITFDSGILFDVDKAALRSEAQVNLEKLAAILNKYSDTNILIEGHTDSTGPDEYNLELSNKRAQSVAGYLSIKEVLTTRFTIMGYGEGQPIADNATVEGRQANRRVELAIMANEKLKKAAENKTG